VLPSPALERLERYRVWLEEEAIPAGAVGRGEAGRLEQRHVADSLLFALALPREGEVWDLGSGAGLPGVPLAIMLPGASLRLVERSGRRASLLRRAVRVLELDNVEVLQLDVRSLEGSVPAIVSRAGLPPDQARKVIWNLLEPGGVAVLGGSWHSRPTVPGWEVMEIPLEVLDQPVWLLIMRHP
jgi:16S rRNA (guanine527-N7)-methyltransferase